jgi:hypothetical protein
MVEITTGMERWLADPADRELQESRQQIAANAGAQSAQANPVFGQAEESADARVAQADEVAARG